MKSHIAIAALSLAVALSAVFVAGCDVSENPSDLGWESIGNSANESTTSGNENSVPTSTGKDTESVPEKQKPDGEPTFLICPDGEPIYTSEITKAIFAQTEIDSKDLTVDTFSTVECDGFVYIFEPRPTINFTQFPEKFEELFVTDAVYRNYVGEEYPSSDEYFRMSVGEKFGNLTLKSAKTTFNTTRLNPFTEVYRDVDGFYLYNAEAEFEGEVEMTGFVKVWIDAMYVPDGVVWFVPDAECSNSIPLAAYDFDSSGTEPGISHKAFASSLGSYGEIEYINLGDMNNSNIDLKGLHLGDDGVRVKVTLKNIRISANGAYGAISAEVVVLKRI